MDFISHRQYKQDNYDGNNDLYEPVFEDEKESDIMLKTLSTQVYYHLIIKNEITLQEMEELNGIMEYNERDEAAEEM